MGRYRIKMVMLIFLVFHNSKIACALFSDSLGRKTFTDEEIAVARYCGYKTLVPLGCTSIANHEKVYHFIAQKHHASLIALAKKFSRAQGIEKKIAFLQKKLLYIQENYLQKKDERYHVLKNKNPDIEILKVTVNFITKYIIKPELIQPRKSYRNERYAIVLWSFLSIIKRHQYITDHDKKVIYKSMDSTLKKLKVPYSNGKTIGQLLGKKHRFCAIL